MSEEPRGLKALKREFYVKFRAFGLQNDSNFFIQNLSVLIGAGMGVPAALGAVYDETRSARMRSAIKEIMDAVDEGYPLSRAIEHAQITSLHTLALISSGEASGRLSANLQIAAIQNQKEAEFRSRVRSALAYSSFVFIIAIVVGVGTAWYILPQIAGFFEALNAPVPPLTRAIIATGEFLEKYGFIFIPLFTIVALLLFYFLFSFPKTRFIGHTIMFHIPLIRTLIAETEIARFGFLSGTMLKAGMPLQEVFTILPETTTFQNYGNLYRFMNSRIQEGYTFKRLFAEYRNLDRVLPSAVRQMIVAAEQSGTLSDTFRKIGELYETKVDATARNIPAFLEPALLLVIGGVVAVLALGILMPVYELGLYF